jgi:hypothetical protein
MKVAVGMGCLCLEGLSAEGLWGGLLYWGHCRLRKEGSGTGIPRNFFEGGLCQEFFLMGVQQIQVSTEGRGNGALGALVPPSQGFHSICKWVKPIFSLGCYGCIFHGTGNSAQLCQNFGISGVLNPPNPLIPRYATGLWRWASLFMGLSWATWSGIVFQ